MAREVSFVKTFPANSSHTRNLLVHGEERKCSPERENADLKWALERKMTPLVEDVYSKREIEKTLV